MTSFRHFGLKINRIL